jgi:hypothetical protein
MARYGRQPLSEILALTANQVEQFSAGLTYWVGIEKK